VCRMWRENRVERPLHDVLGGGGGVLGHDDNSPLAPNDQAQRTGPPRM